MTEPGTPRDAVGQFGRSPRRPHRGLMLLLVGVVVLGLTTLAGAVVLRQASLRSDRPIAATTRQPQARVVPPLGAAESRAAAIDALLDRRAAAILRRDRRAFLATVDSGVPAFRRSQERLFDALSGVRFSTWRYSVDKEAPARAVPRPARFAGFSSVYAPSLVLVEHRLAGYDAEPTTTGQYLTFVRRGSTWRLGADSDFDGTRQRTGREVWDFGPVRSVRGESSLVLGHPRSGRLLASLAAEADRDVRRVSRVWGSDWSQQVVVVVPGDQKQLAAIIDRPVASLDRIAAVATAELRGGGAPVAVGNRVLVNPGPVSRLDAIGRQIVMTHEMTHVATRAVTAAAAPTWLVEGFADYVAYRSAGVAVPSAARDLRSEVVEGRVPVALPRNEDFAGSNPRLAQAYEEAWLAVRLIADRAGEAGLLQFYRAVAGPNGHSHPGRLAESLQSIVGLSPTAFTAAWRTYLRTELA